MPPVTPPSASVILPPLVPVSSPAPATGIAAVPDPGIATATLPVLHLVNGEHFSGAERVQSHLGRCLPERGFEADFACVKPGRFAEQLEAQEGRWGRAFRIPMRNRFDVQAAQQIGLLVRREGYRLLHAHTPRTALLAALAAPIARVPWVYHVHSPASRDSARRWLNRINALVESYAVRNCAHLITVSQSLRDDCLRQGVPEEKVSVVHNGVPAIRPARNRIPQLGGRWTLGMVALMRPRKGLEVALQALAQLRSHDVHLRCVGPFESEEYEAEIVRLIRELGLRDRVQLEGFCDDVPRMLADLDALVLPSLYGEGLPMVVLEAMAAGVPVIATEVEGTPEAIRDGVEGLLAEPRCPESLADRIRSLVAGQHDWEAMSQAAVRRHAECFSDRAMAEGTAAVYRRVLGAAIRP